MSKLRTFVMLLLFSAAAVLEAFRLSSPSALTNCDIWWHLSSGLWILHNHAFPHNGIFSQVSAQAWTASSWGYELLLALTYHLLGLRSIPLFLIFFRCVLAVLAFLLAGGARGKFWPAVGLSVVAQYVLGSIPPGPAYVSVLFFAVELLILLEARRSGRESILWWLVPLFFLWANLHMQFVYGVAVLLVFLGAAVIEKPARPRLTSVHVGKIIAACIVVTVFTPYLWGGYAAFFRTALNAGNKYLPDFQALGFRQAQDYLMMLLAMSAFLALGLRRTRDWFQIAVLAGCLGLSFHARRDAWLVTLAALAVIGEALASEPAEVLAQPEAECVEQELVGVVQGTSIINKSMPQRLKPQSLSAANGTSGTRALPGGDFLVSASEATATRALPGGDSVQGACGAAESRTLSKSEAQESKKTFHSCFSATSMAASAAIGIVLVVFGLRVPSKRETLLAKAGQSYPVAACDYIRDHQLAKPMFNAYEWGGFLSWYLPEYPVAIDSRTDLYGGDAIVEYSRVMNAEVRYTEYPAMAEAQTILLPKSSIMASALSSVPIFKVAYSDDVAVVLSRRSANE